MKSNMNGNLEIYKDILVLANLKDDYPSIVTLIMLFYLLRRRSNIKFNTSVKPQTKSKVKNISMEQI